MQTDSLEYVASLVLEGYKYGYSPDWDITISEVNHSDLSDNTFLYIAEKIQEGYIQGEIQEEDKSGWWFLKIYE